MGVVCGRQIRMDSKEDYLKACKKEHDQMEMIPAKDLVSQDEPEDQYPTITTLETTLESTIKPDEDQAKDT